MRVLCLQGSLGRPSHTATMMQVVARLLEAEGVEAEYVDLREVRLPMPDPQHHHDPTGHPDAVVRDLAERAQAADGFVIGTPVYHNSYSGVLKVALDHLSIAQFDGKPVALCGNGGRRASVQPVDHLRIVVRGLHGVAIPYNIVSSTGDYVESDCELRVREEGLVNRLQLMVRQLLHFCRALKPVVSDAR